MPLRLVLLLLSLHMSSEDFLYFLITLSTGNYHTTILYHIFFSSVFRFLKVSRPIYHSLGCSGFTLWANWLTRKYARQEKAWKTKWKKNIYIIDTILSSSIYRTFRSSIYTKKPLCQDFTHIKGLHNQVTKINNYNHLRLAYIWKNE